MSQPPKSNQIISQFFSRAISLVVTFILNTFVVRHLGASDIGLIAFANAFVFLTAPLFALGTRESSDIAIQGSDNPAEILQVALLIQISGSIVQASLIIMILVLIQPSDINTMAALFITSILSNLFGFNQTLGALMLKQGKGNNLAVSDLITTLISIVLTCTALATSANIIIFAFLTTITAFTQLVIRLWQVGNFSKQYGFRLTTSIQRKALQRRARELICFSKPFLISSLAITIYMRSDQIMLELIIDSNAVGVYSIGMRLLETSYFIPMLLSKNYLTKVSNELGSKKQNYLESFYRLMWVTGTGLTLLYLTIMPMVVVPLYGEEFSAGSTYIKLMAPSLFAVSIGLSTNVWLNASGKTSISAERTLIAAALNIILNFALIPSFSGVGAAAATTISQFVSCFAVALWREEIRENILLALFPFKPLIKKCDFKTAYLFKVRDKK